MCENLRELRNWAAHPSRTPKQFLSLVPTERDLTGTKWKVVQADHPGDVTNYLRLRCEAAKVEKSKHKDYYGVAEIGEFKTWAEAADALARVIPDISTECSVNRRLLSKDA